MSIHVEGSTLKLDKRWTSTRIIRRRNKKVKAFTSIKNKGHKKKKKPWLVKKQSLTSPLLGHLYCQIGWKHNNQEDFLAWWYTQNSSGVQKMYLIYRDGIFSDYSIHITHIYFDSAQCSHVLESYVFHPTWLVLIHWSPWLKIAVILLDIGLNVTARCTTLWCVARPLWPSWMPLLACSLLCYFLSWWYHAMISKLWQ